MAKTKQPKKSPPCDCITQLNKQLEPYNTKLDLVHSINFDSGVVETYVKLAVLKIDKKKRSGPQVVVASYCPICGRKL